MKKIKRKEKLLKLAMWLTEYGYSSGNSKQRRFMKRLAKRKK